MVGGRLHSSERSTVSDLSAHELLSLRRLVSTCASPRCPWVCTATRQGVRRERIGDSAQATPITGLPSCSSTARVPSLPSAS